MTQTSTPSGGPPSGSATEKASRVAQVASDAGSDVAQTAVEQAKGVTAETGQQARNLIHETREQLQEQAGTQQRKAVDGLRSLTEELHAMADSGQSGPASELARQAADRARQAADWLEQREPGDLVEELRRLGRQRPGAFLAGAALAGVLAGRMTRGVVAAHSDDTPTSADGERAQPAPYTAPQVSADYGAETAGYATGGSTPTPYPPPAYPPEPYAPGLEPGAGYDPPGSYQTPDPATGPGVEP